MARLKLHPIVARLAAAMRRTSPRVLSLAIATLVTALAMSARADAATFTTIYSFARTGADRSGPAGALTQFRGHLYGIQQRGSPAYGPITYGGVFKVSPEHGTGETIFRFKSNVSPGALTELNGNLYGVTTFGGACGCGTIYTINPSTHAEAVVYSFEGGIDGAYPNGLTLLDGIFYGTTFSGGGGDGSNSTIFSFDPVSNTKTILHTQSQTEGVGVQSALVRHGGRLYGSACEGGTQNLGTVFEYDPSTGREKTVHDFANFTSSVGACPEAGLIVHGTDLFGTTFLNNDRYGSIFQIDLTTGDAVPLYNFTDTSRQGVPLGLSLYQDGFLYSLTGRSGPDNPGTVFKLNVATQELTTLYTFTGGMDGWEASSPLLSYQGAFYGTTATGGSNGIGSVFKLVP